MDGVLFVQLNTVPGIVPVNATGAVDAPLHITWLTTAFTVGNGLIVPDTATFSVVAPLDATVIYLMVYL